MKLRLSSLLLSLPVLTLVFSEASFAGPSAAGAFNRTKSLVAEKAPGYVRESLDGRLQKVERNLKELENSLHEIESSIQHHIPAEKRALFVAHAIELRSAIAKDVIKALPTNPPKEPHNGYFCVSACKNGDGKASLYITGIAGLDRLLTQQAANEKLAGVYNCPQGLVEVGCEERTHNPTAFTCQAACADANGLPQITYAAAGQGFSEAEAFMNASASVASKWNCPQGIAKYKCVKN